MFRLLLLLALPGPALADNSFPQAGTLLGKPVPSAPQPGRYAVAIDFLKEKYPTREIYEHEVMRSRMVLQLGDDGGAELLMGYERYGSGSVSHFASADHEDHESKSKEGSEECHSGRWARRGSWIDIDFEREGCSKSAHPERWRVSCAGVADQKNLPPGLLVCEAERLNEAFKIPLDQKLHRAVLARDPGLSVTWRDERYDRTPRIRLLVAPTPIKTPGRTRP